MSRDATAVVAIEPPARGTFGKLLAAVTAKPEGMQPRHLTLEFGVELPEVLQAVSPLLERQLSFEYRPSRGEPDVRYGTSFRLRGLDPRHGDVHFEVADRLHDRSTSRCGNEGAAARAPRTRVG
jgi:hypothetical protein